MISGKKLSIKKVYTSAAKYIFAHPKGFLFLTIFYYLESLIFSASPFLHLLGLYLLIYLAAGLYYKQRLILNTETFLHATLRFVTAVMLFIISLILSSLCINLIIHIFCNGHGSCYLYTNHIIESNLGITVKYIVLFFLLVACFLIPSFAFLSEISGKSRSVISAYAKTKGSFASISVCVLTAIIITWLFMAVFAFVNPYIAQFAYTTALVFGTIVYFKMYDFFYGISETKRTAGTKEEKALKTVKPEENEANVNQR